MPLQRIQNAKPDEKTISQLQDNINKALAPIESALFVGGVLLTDINLVAGSNRISHTLKRTPRIWVVTDINSADTVYRTAWDAQYIYLTASGTVTVSLWVN